MELEKKIEKEYSAELNLTSTGKPSWSVRVKTDDINEVESSLRFLKGIVEPMAHQIAINQALGGK